MPSDKISVGTCILFYVMYPQPRLPCPLCPNSSHAKSQPPTSRHTELRPFFNKTASNMQWRKSTLNARTPEIKEDSAKSTPPQTGRPPIRTSCPESPQHTGDRLPKIGYSRN